jgi:DNA-binding NarL/FixJ family response regulator
MRILVVDDNKMIRGAIRNLLSKESGWEICGEATDGPEAVEKTRELQPDLILLDISMPNGNGLETAQLIRQEGFRSNILVMSHHDPVHLRQSALESGANGCVDKSRMGSDLVNAIRELPKTSERPGT